MARCYASHHLLPPATQLQSSPHDASDLVVSFPDALDVAAAAKQMPACACACPIARALAPHNTKHMLTRGRRVRVGVWHGTARQKIAGNLVDEMTANAKANPAGAAKGLMKAAKK